MRLVLTLLVALSAAAPVQATGLSDECSAAPTPVHSLAYGSRYTAESENRSDLDAQANRAVDEALGPVDDFLRDLARAANSALEDPTDGPGQARCTVAQIAEWARAGALNDLQTPTARLTIGSRIAGLALTLRQVAPHADPGDLSDSLAWLGGLVEAQMLFWEEDAPPGARQGNLRAWAALAAAAVSDLSDDPVQRGWAAWSARYVMCKAAPDGSLPQEMSRGRHALHYQLHSVAPLVVTAVLLKRKGSDLSEVCDGALHRAVAFTAADVVDGMASQAITGERQTYFDGTREISGFNLAWAEAYLTLRADAGLDALVEPFRPLSHSKLGGNQTLIWSLGD
ncbi:MAG: alginate lyase family protein [Pseudomonadota bacterium]